MFMLLNIALQKQKSLLEPGWCTNWVGKQEVQQELT